jgi:hypothetical protein
MALNEYEMHWLEGGGSRSSQGDIEICPKAAAEIIRLQNALVEIRDYLRTDSASQIDAVKLIERVFAH